MKYGMLPVRDWTHAVFPRWHSTHRGLFLSKTLITVHVLKLCQKWIITFCKKKKKIVHDAYSEGGGTSKLTFFWSVCTWSKAMCLTQTHTYTKKKLSNVVFVIVTVYIRSYGVLLSIILMRYQCLVHLSSFLLSMVVGVGLTCCCSPPFTVDSVEKISSPVPLSLSEVIWVSFRLVFSTPPSSSNTFISRSL